MNCCPRRFISLVSLLLYINLCCFASDLFIVDCLKGEGNDQLKSIENFDGNNFLINIRTNSNTQDFKRNRFANDSLFGNNWLIKLNDNGDTIWRKMIPNTDRILQEEVVSNSSGQFLTFPKFDYLSKIHTIENNEIMLHYTYADSISLNDLSVLSNEYITTKHSYYLDFGVLSANGNYRLFPFSIDSFPVDNITRFQQNNIVTNKVNDSIYQLACSFGRQNFLNVYSININTKEVFKNIFEEVDFFGQVRFYDVLGLNNKLYILNRVNLDTIVSLFALNENVELELEILLPKEVYSFSKLPNGNLLFNAKEYIDIAGKHTEKSYYLVMNTSDYNFVRHDIVNNFSNSTYDAVTIINSYQPPAIPIGIKEKTNNNAYFLVKEEYGSTFPYSVSNKLVKINVITGNQIWSKAIDSVSYFTNDKAGNNLIFNHYLAANNFINKNSITMMDSNGIQKWKIRLPESILYKNKLVYAHSEINFYRAINYYNHFVVGSSYIDSATNTVYPVYFFISNTIGAITQKDLSEINVVEDFCNTNSNQLFVIGQETDKCIASSKLDVSIYKFIGVLTAITSNNKIVQDDFLLFPNPSNNAIQIKYTGSINEESFIVKIIDISGQIILQTMFDELQSQLIDVHYFPTGMYFLQVDAKDFHLTKKFQVIH